MYSGTDVEGNETEMWEELSISINDPQSERPTQGLDSDRFGFTTWVTRANTLPDPVLKQTNAKQGFINPKHI